MYGGVTGLSQVASIVTMVITMLMAAPPQHGKGEDIDMVISSSSHGQVCNAGSMVNKQRHYCM